MFAKFARRFRNGWVFGGEALGVIWSHPRLLVFPVLIVAAIIAVIAAGIALTYWSLLAESGPLGYLVWFAFYVLAWAAMIYLSVALSATVLAHHHTHEMSLVAGFRIANGRIGAILAWALFAATVGLLLRCVSRILEDWLGRVGHWIGEMIGYSWLIAAYFVIPIIVMEGDTPFSAMKRSMETIKSQWGDAVGMEASMFWRLWPLLAISVGLPTIVFWSADSMAAVALMNPYLVFAVVVATILASVAFSAMIHTMGPIARARHYYFVTTGDLPPGADAETYAGLSRS